MIPDVVITPLKIIADERGSVMHMLRADADHFQSFGEVYFSTINPGSVKAWKRHLKMTLNLACVSGSVRLVICDRHANAEPAIQEIDLSPDEPEKYVLITVPAGLWTGFMCTGPTPAIIANCASIPHDPDEAESWPANTDQIPYSWT